MEKFTFLKASVNDLLRKAESSLNFLEEYGIYTKSHRKALDQIKKILSLPLDKKNFDITFLNAIVTSLYYLESLLLIEQNLKKKRNILYRKPHMREFDYISPRKYDKISRFLQSLVYPFLDLIKKMKLLEQEVAEKEKAEEPSPPPAEEKETSAELPDILGSPPPGYKDPFAIGGGGDISQQEEKLFKYATQVSKKVLNVTKLLSKERLLINVLLNTIKSLKERFFLLKAYSYTRKQLTIVLVFENILDILEEQLEAILSELEVSPFLSEETEHFITDINNFLRRLVQYIDLKLSTIIQEEKSTEEDDQERVINKTEKESTPSQESLAKSIDFRVYHPTVVEQDSLLLEQSVGYLGWSHENIRKLQRDLKRFFRSEENKRRFLYKVIDVFVFPENYLKIDSLDKFDELGFFPNAPRINTPLDVYLFFDAVFGREKALDIYILWILDKYTLIPGLARIYEALGYGSRLKLDPKQQRDFLMSILSLDIVPLVEIVSDDKLKRKIDGSISKAGNIILDKDPNYKKVKPFIDNLLKKYLNKKIQLFNFSAFRDKISTIIQTARRIEMQEKAREAVQDLVNSVRGSKAGVGKSRKTRKGQKKYLKTLKVRSYIDLVDVIFRFSRELQHVRDLMYGRRYLNLDKLIQTLIQTLNERLPDNIFVTLVNFISLSHFFYIITSSLNDIIRNRKIESDIVDPLASLQNYLQTAMLNFMALFCALKSFVSATEIEKFIKDVDLEYLKEILGISNTKDICGYQLNKAMMDRETRLLSRRIEYSYIVISAIKELYKKIRPSVVGAGQNIPKISLSLSDLEESNFGQEVFVNLIEGSENGIFEFLKKMVNCISSLNYLVSSSGMRSPANLAEDLKKNSECLSKVNQEINSFVNQTLNVCSKVEVVVFNRRLKSLNEDIKRFLSNLNRRFKEKDELIDNVYSIIEKELLSFKDNIQKFVEKCFSVEVKEQTRSILDELEFLTKNIKNISKKPSGYSEEISKKMTPEEERLFQKSQSILGFFNTKEELFRFLNDPTNFVRGKGRESQKGKHEILDHFLKTVLSSAAFLLTGPFAVAMDKLSKGLTGKGAYDLLKHIKDQAWDKVKKLISKKERTLDQAIAFDQITDALKRLEEKEKQK